MMGNRQDRTRDVESGEASSEATPLLVTKSSNAEEPATADFGAVAPPPAAAPPPPPDGSPGEQIMGGDAASSYQQQPQESLTPLLSARDDDNTSQSQLSQSVSAKSGKSRRKRKKKTGDAASTKSGRSSVTKAKKRKKKEGPQKSICHLMFDLVRYVAIMASACMLAMQALPLIVMGKQRTWLQVAVRSYLALFCVSFILAEVRVPFLQKIALHDNWILKGFLYSFIGLIGMEQDLAVKVEDIAAGTSSVLGPDYATLFATLFMSITTWLMIAVGIIYTGLGLLCMQRWYEKLETDHREKVKAWKQKKKREEEFRKEKEEHRQIDKDWHEGRGKWYDDLED
ncbi:hypothetical protein ACHAXT_012444 [Thalassiosira profunda]